MLPKEHKADNWHENPLQAQSTVNSGQIIGQAQKFSLKSTHTTLGSSTDSNRLKNSLKSSRIFIYPSSLPKFCLKCQIELIKFPQPPQKTSTASPKEHKTLLISKQIYFIEKKIKFPSSKLNYSVIKSLILILLKEIELWFEKFNYPKNVNDPSPKLFNIPQAKKKYLFEATKTFIFLKTYPSEKYSFFFCKLCWIENTQAKKKVCRYFMNGKEEKINKHAKLIRRHFLFQFFFYKY